MGIDPQQTPAHYMELVGQSSISLTAHSTYMETPHFHSVLTSKRWLNRGNRLHFKLKSCSKNKQKKIEILIFTDTPMHHDKSSFHWTVKEIKTTTGFVHYSFIILPKRSSMSASIIFNKSQYRQTWQVILLLVTACQTKSSPLDNRGWPVGKTYRRVLKIKHSYHTTNLAKVTCNIQCKNTNAAET